MAERGKRIVVEGDILDIISSLPSNVITHILDFLPLNFLAKTSILSRNWRYIWASHPNIKIHHNSLAFNKIKNMSYIINKILLQHIGPILKFSLDFLPTDDFDHSSVDQWLLYLSRNGIKELTIDCITSKACCTLPSHIFSAPELVVLNLTNIIFKPPNVHAYFRKITILNFSQIDFELLKLTSAINTPHLTHLTFTSCHGICNFKICAPKLKTFSIEDSYNVELNGFEMPEIATLALTDYDSEETSLTELFEKWRLISWFYVSGNSFEYLVADITHLETLPIMAVRLRHLVIEDMDLGDLHQISCMLYLLKSSTALSRLEISVARFIDRDMTNETSEVLQYLDSPHNMKWTTNSLEVLVIDYICEPEIEMCLIKYLLSRAPKLKRMFLHSCLGERDIFKLAKRLLRFPRASTEAEIIFEQNVRVTRVPVVYSLS